jgi:hypothetical protein
MPRDKKDDRQDPLSRRREPRFQPQSEVVPQATQRKGTPDVLSRQPSTARKSSIHPAEKRRKARKLTVTFSDSAIPDRLRALAERWGLRNYGGSPSPSAVVEYLLSPQLEAAERGEIDPPEVDERGRPV